MRASIITLGCKVNEYESQSMLNQLKRAGYQISEGLVFADVYIINTCAVTNMAERKSRQVLSKIIKLNPNAKIVVCGCAVQNNPSQFLVNPNVIAIVGNRGKHQIIKHIINQNKALLKLENKKYLRFARPIQTRTRQYIKIQDGCDYFCTYCLIPYVRGRSRSRALADILSEIKNTKASEVVLTGINMSDYRIDNQLALKTLVTEVDKLNKRFRLSSIECNVLDDEMITILSKLKNFCPHFHLSLQSACNDTLKRMNRRYTIEEFISKVNKIKNAFPNVFIATDVIVGFKGETDQEFETTYKNLKKINFDFIHIFPYSERSGTVACKLSGSVDKATVQIREKRLQELNILSQKRLVKNNLNTLHNLLIEETDDKCSYGYTENYIYTKIDGVLPVGKIVKVKLIDEYAGGMIGQKI